MIAPASEDAARAYHRRQLLAGLLGLGLSAGYLVALVLTGAGGAAAAAAARVTDRWWLQLPLVLLALALPHRLLTLPLAWWRGWALPRRYGLVHQSLGGWALDGLKATALAAGLGLLLAEIVYALLRASAWWWLWAALAMTAVAALLTLMAPVALLPLFYRLRPLEDAALAERLVELAGRTGVPVLGVWVADQSAKSRTANAAVTGLWGTRRIILFDTLLERFTPEQIAVVLAHELAHHAHGDVWRGLVVHAGLSLATFGVADRLLRTGAAALGLEGPADLAGLPLLALVLLALSLVAAPLANAWSRRAERRADDRALAVTRDPAALVGAMERLAELNLAEYRPHPLKERLLASHPSVASRIERARAWTARQGG